MTKARVKQNTLAPALITVASIDLTNCGRKCWIQSRKGEYIEYDSVTKVK